MTEQTDAELAAKCRLPGPTGAKWRLVRAWPPKGLEVWFHEEMLRNTSAADASMALGSMLADVAWCFALGCSDVREALLQPKMGVVSRFQEHLQQLVNDRGYERTDGGVLVRPSKINGGG